MTADHAHRRSPMALFGMGFVTFALLYAVQPLLPALARSHRLHPADSALALSCATGALALSIWLCATCTPRWNRQRLMLSALLLASLFNALSALSGSWQTLLLCRTLMGFCLGAVPAMAMAHVAETAPPGTVPSAMGLYVAGTALGGMTGRVGLALMADTLGWAAGLLSVSALAVLGVVGIRALMGPPLTPPTPLAGRWPPAQVWRQLLTDAGLIRLLGCGALASGLFVSAYNYAGFRLQAAPFSLSPGQIGLIFGCYAFGVASSGIAGRLASRHGQGPVLALSVAITAAGIVVSQSRYLPAFVAGLSLMTIGFFALHAVCSGWVGQLAPSAAKAQATAAYLLAYYLGASVLGYAGGWAWDHGGWPGLSLGLGAALLAFAWLCRGVLAAERTSAPTRDTVAWTP